MTSCNQFLPEHDDLLRFVAVGLVELDQEFLGDVLHVLDDFLVLSAVLHADFTLVEGQRLGVHGAHHCGNGRLFTLKISFKSIVPYSYAFV